MALGIIGLMLVINIIGIKESAMMTIIFTIIEVGGLVFVIYTAWPTLATGNYVEMPAQGAQGILIGGALSFFAYKGFENIVKLSEETKEPEKNIPRAIFISSAIVFVLYMLVAFAAVSAVPVEKVAGSDNPLSVIVESRFGLTGAMTIAVIALFSTSNTLLSSLHGSSRIIYSMSLEAKRGRFFSNVSPRRKTPIPALILSAIIAGFSTLAGDLKTVAIVSNIIVFACFILVNVSVIYLRYNRKNAERPYRIPISFGNMPLIPLLAIFLTLMMLILLIKELINGSLE